jgi:low temperature requirement protein LtrA
MDGGSTKRISTGRLWSPPARFADRPTDRRVTFLELFFDLVFVVVIAQLADRLASTSPIGVPRRRKRRW